VIGIDNRDTVFRLKPIFSSSGAMRMPNVGILLGFEEKEALNFGTEDRIVSWIARGRAKSEGILYTQHMSPYVEWRFIGLNVA